MLELEDRAAPLLDSISDGGKLEKAITTERAAEIETQGKCGGRVARAALFDAVTMASQNDESIGDAKAQRAARLAEQLNVEAETCMEVLSIVSEEISLQRRKAKLFLA